MELNLLKSTKIHQSEKTLDENFLFDNFSIKLTKDQLKKIIGGDGDDDPGKVKW